MSRKPTDVEQGLKLAEKCLHGGYFDDTIQLCSEIIKIKASNADAYYYMGLAIYRLGQLPLAIAHLETAIEFDSTRTDFLCALGEILENSGLTKEAESQYRKALIIDRNITKALIKLGTLLLNRGQYKLGTNALEKALNLEPKNIEAIVPLIDAKNKMGQIIDALNLNLLATSIAPLQERVWNSLANIHMELEDWKNAGTEFKKALVLAPHHSGPWSNIGFVYMNYGNFVSARRCFNLSIRVRSDVGNAYCGLAELSYHENKLAESLKNSEIAIKIDPMDYHYQSRRALQLLATGNLTDGWNLRDARLMLDHRIEHRQRPPRWDGSPLKEKTLLITAEEGIGDELFFASCINDAVSECKQCFIECDPRLLELYKRSFPAAIVGATERTGSRFKPVQSYDWLPKTPPIDFSIESGSLFKFFRPNWKRFGNKQPYLKPNTNLQIFWREFFAKTLPGLKVGFCWRSKYHDGFRKYHYANLLDWAPVLTTPSCSFISLQYGEEWEEEIHKLPSALNSKITILENADLSNDFETICAVTSCLDLIICPSSTVSWIGGALGVPTWVTHLQPNWTKLGTNSFPGFPSMESFPKEIFDPWVTCFDPIRTRLDNYVKYFLKQDR